VERNQQHRCDGRLFEHLCRGEVVFKFSDQRPELGGVKKSNFSLATIPHPSINFPTLVPPLEAVCDEIHTGKGFPGLSFRHGAD